MSTRATYRFTGRKSEYRSAQSLCLYIHHDGYPAGAASYFYMALVHPNQRGYGPEQMMRANEGAEITTAHDDHGDTEYRYDVTRWTPGAEVIAYSRKFSHSAGEEDRWVSIFTGTLADFIDLQANASPEGLFVENYSRFRQVKLPYNAVRWMNLDIARRRVNAEDHSLLHTLKIWRDRFVGSANWDSLANELRAILAEFPELATDETTELLSLSVPVA